MVSYFMILKGGIRRCGSLKTVGSNRGISCSMVCVNPRSCWSLEKKPAFSCRSCVIRGLSSTERKVRLISTHPCVIFRTCTGGGLATSSLVLGVDASVVDLHPDKTTSPITKVTNLALCHTMTSHVNRLQTRTETLLFWKGFTNRQIILQ